MEPSAFKDIAAEVSDFERKLERLRVTYEQYFLGIEKREPAVQLKEVVRVMRKLDNETIQNTALRYKLRTLVQKFNTYRNYWNRTLRAIEAGTYHRDLARVRRKMQRKGIEMPELGKLKRSGDVERALAEAAEKARELERQKKQRRSASAIRGRPADDLTGQPHTFDDGATNEWPSPVESWEPSFDEGDVDQAFESAFDDTTSDTEPGAASPFAAPATGPVGPPSSSLPQGGRASPPPIPADADDLDSLDELARRPARDLPARPLGRQLRRPGGDLSARPQPSTAPPSGAARPPAATGASDGLSKDKMDSLYRRYMRAKTMCGEDPTTVRYDSLVKTIERQLPKIREMHAGREIDFQVVIRDGRAILKAKPK
ncbi:MAG: hypothetical protein CSA65_05625 [Proteobacteria bacterium]|nr:MAG: hypothetical protein CSB49_01955 [Pseudomonadota bacterium]PIE18197.1 MAG: hypothetical protein CSA65_05625 [Pseudomonadota bacterium]